mgnify:CR=1 FL=1
MTVKEFVDFMTAWDDFAYDDGRLNIGVYPRNRNFVCCHGADSYGVTFTSIDDVLDKFIIDGKPFRDILPTLDDNLL